MKISKKMHLLHGETNRWGLLSIIVIKAFAVWRQRDIQSQKSMYSKYIHISRMRAFTKSPLLSLTLTTSKSKNPRSGFQPLKNDGGNFTGLNLWPSLDRPTAFTMTRSKIISSTWRDLRVRMKRSFRILWTALITSIEGLSSYWRPKNYHRYTKGTKRSLRIGRTKESICAQSWRLRDSWRTLKISTLAFNLTLRRGQSRRGNFRKPMSKFFSLVMRYGNGGSKRGSRTREKSTITSLTFTLR